jgi:nucleoside-diphosphate-sugar epimerase
MKIFVTGASGWIGSATTAELIEAGHEVVGLARSDEGAAKVASLGATVQRGDLTDHDSLRAGAEGVDGIVHLGYNHDFSQMEKAGQTDNEAMTLFGDILDGSGGPLVFASGILGAVSVETDRPDPATSWSPRLKTESMALSWGETRGIRSAAVRFAPTVHGEGDHGFIQSMVNFDRAAGKAGYIGSTRWPAVNRLDAAHLVRLVVEQAPGNTIAHAIGEDAVPLKAVAEVVGRKLGLPVVDLTPDEAIEQFTWLGRFLAVDSTASSAITQEAFGWKPTHPTLLEDLEAGYYTK